MRQLPCLDLLNTDVRVTAFGLRCSRRIAVIAFTSGDDPVGAALGRVTRSLGENESRDADLERLRGYSAGFPILDDTSVRGYYEVTAVNLALMSIVDDDGQGLLPRARRIMHTAMGAWYELGYLTALRAGVQDAAISSFADELRDLEVEQQCKDVTGLSVEDWRKEFDPSIEESHCRKVAQKLIWFIVEQGCRWESWSGWGIGEPW